LVDSVRLILSYEGTRYHGWQVQPGYNTSQKTLEDAYRQLAGVKTRMLAAGRTDTGVHAAGQVVCFENPSRHSPDVVRDGLNRFLPEDIAVVSAEPAPPGFDPRRSSVGKHYRYTIHNTRVRPVLERNFRWHVKAPLDVDAMNRAARCLLGEHDFSSFRASGCESAHPVRTLDALGWKAEPPVLTFDVFGRGFLKQMVRNLVGTFVEIGRGRWRAEDMQRILQSHDRTSAGPCALAHGLCLVMVYYDEEAYAQAMEKPRE
jgi:tRNA pseudouridine38-40 synthase